jgi:hypothetical protein
VLHRPYRYRYPGYCLGASEKGLTGRHSICQCIPKQVKNVWRADCGQQCTVVLRFFKFVVCRLEMI